MAPHFQGKAVKLSLWVSHVDPGMHKTVQDQQELKTLHQGSLKVCGKQPIIRDGYRIQQMSH